MPPTVDPVMAVIGLITQLKTIFRHIASFMSGMTRPSRLLAVSASAIAAARSCSSTQGIAGHGVFDDAGARSTAPTCGSPAA